MPEFDLDNLKKTWQEHTVEPKYSNTEIEAMLNKSSRNYVKYILCISIAEFLVILCLNTYYTFSSDDAGSFIKMLEKLGVQNTLKLQADFAHLYFVLKIISLLVTAFFVIRFYQNYRKIHVESNLKKLILQIIRFKKTVNLFILINILLLLAFTAVLTVFSFIALAQQSIHLNHPTLIGFIVGLVVMTLISVLLIWVYYRIVYGIILKRLGKNLTELQRIDNQEL